jgi:membrane protein implicated in regulation of membrane protease activity
MSSKSDRESFLELFEEVANWLTGFGMITFAIFPFAVPLIALTALLAIPVVIGGLLVAVLTAPVLLVGRVARARRREAEPSTQPRGRQATGPHSDGRLHVTTV